MQKFKKIAIEVNAVQWRGDNRTEIELFVGKRLKTTAVPHQMERELDNIPHEAYTIEIPTREGMQTAVRNDWIIQGHSNEYGYHFWVNKPDYFRKAYEPVEDQDTSVEPAAETENIDAVEFVEWANWNFIWEDKDKWTHADTTQVYTTGQLYAIFQKEPSSPSVQQEAIPGAEKEMQGHDYVICPSCGGDGKETCNNPDHGFIEAMPGEIGRLGCPVCGHDPNHKVNGGRNICSLCGGHGHIWYDVAEDWAKETGYDDEFLPYLPFSPPSVKTEREDEWKPFNGDYEKEMQDIKLHDGTVIEMCWPNAGLWMVCKSCQPACNAKGIPVNEAAFVRKNKEFYGQEPSQPSPTEQEGEFKQDFHPEHVEFLSLMRGIRAERASEIAKFIERQNKKIAAIREEKIASLQSQLYNSQQARNAIRWVLENTDGRTIADLEVTYSQYLQSKTPTNE